MLFLRPKLSTAVHTWQENYKKNFMQLTFCKDLKKPRNF